MASVSQQGAGDSSSPFGAPHPHGSPLGSAENESAYMKDLFERVIVRSKTAMVDLDCLAPIRRFSAEIEAAAGGAD